MLIVGILENEEMYEGKMTLIPKATAKRDNPC